MCMCRHGIVVIFMISSFFWCILEEVMTFRNQIRKAHTVDNDNNHNNV